MRRLILAILMFSVTVAATAQSAPAVPSKAAATKAENAAAVDRAYLQSIWDGWAAADLDKQTHLYAQGPNHLFFDVAPLKYNSWDEYKAGVAPSLKDSAQSDVQAKRRSADSSRGPVYLGGGNAGHVGDVGARRSAEADAALDRRTGAAGRPLGDHA